MANIEDQFNADITSLMDDAFGETWTTETGSAITAQFTLLREEPMEDAPGKYARMVAELRWQKASLAAPIPPFKFTDPEGYTWTMNLHPEEDRHEVIATVYRIKRNRTGAV